MTITEDTRVVCQKNSAEKYAEKENDQGSDVQKKCRGTECRKWRGAENLVQKMTMGKNRACTI